MKKSSWFNALTSVLKRRFWFSSTTLVSKVSLRTEVGKYAMVKPPAVTTALQKLTSPEVRQVVQLVSGKYRLTDLGSKRIREKLPDKLLLT